MRRFPGLPGSMPAGPDGLGVPLLLPSTSFLSTALLCTACLLGSLGGCSPSSDPPPPAAEPPAVNGPALTEGSPVEVEIHSSEPWVFPLDLQAGHAVDLEVQQLGGDVAVALLRPGGETLCRVDSPNGNQGPERLVAVAREDGRHLLVVEPWQPGDRGPLRITVRHRGPPRRRDPERAAACRLGWEADRLRASQELEELERAVEAYRQVGAAWRQLDEPYLAAAAVIERDGVLLDLHRYREVVESSSETLGQVEALGAVELEPALLNQQGLALRRLDRLEEAAATYERALSVAEELGNQRERALTLNNLALVVGARGEPWQALALFEAALEELRALGDRNSVAIALHNLGDLQLWAERREQARESLEQALALMEELGQDRERIGTLTSLATVAFQAGDLTTAFQRLEEAESLARQVEDRIALGIVLDRLGSVREAAGDPAEAVAAYEAALATFAGDPVDEATTREDSANEARTFSNLGRVRTALGDLPEARRLLDRAIDTLQRSGEPASEAAARFHRACVARRQGRLASAWEDLERAVELSEKLRAAVGSQELRSLFFASIQDYFDELVDLAMELDGRNPGEGYRQRAVELAEARRSRSLLDLVAGRRSASGEEPRLRARRGEVLRRLSQLRSRRLQALSREAPRERLATLENEIQRLERQRERLDHPVDSLVASEPLSFRSLQAQLDKETVLLVYSLGRTRSWAWLVSLDGIEARPLADRESLETLALRLHRLVPKRDVPGVGDQARHTAAALGREILEPFADIVPAGARLAILADGALRRVPFSVLPWGEPGELLLHHHEVVQLPSVSVLAALRQRRGGRPRAPRAVALVADPVFSLDDPRIPGAAPEAPILARQDEPERPTRASSLEYLDRLPRLLATRREAEAILAPLTPDDRWLALGFDAHRDNFLQAPLEDFRILHLATHTLLDDELAERVGVVLSRFTETGERRDGFLHLFEIAELPLAADLVVLSACHTGLGQMIRGEGLVGLPQSFFDAGATRVLVSLWSIDDEATAHFMEHFYRHLRGGLPPGEALRQAQLDLRRNPRWQGPAYWAPFVLQGDWRGFD